MGSSNIRREESEKALSLADLAQAIERRQIPALRDGDEYVLRSTDIRELRTRAVQGIETVPSHETLRETLEMGRSA